MAERHPVHYKPHKWQRDIQYITNHTNGRETSSTLQTTQMAERHPVHYKPHKWQRDAHNKISRGGPHLRKQPHQHNYVSGCLLQPTQQIISC